MSARHTQPADLGASLRLTKREARAIERQAARLERARPTSTTEGSWWSRLTTALQESRDLAATRPGRRGWAGKGTGRINYIETPVEWQGTTVQVCGLWPFIGGSSTPAIGVPLGRHLLKDTFVCADPVYWFLGNLILNPSAFVLGRPGLGKSTLIRRMCTVLEAWGVVPMILGDTKPDYVALMQAMEGQVISVGRGRGHINPLDLKDLLDALSQIPDAAARRAALDEMSGRRLNTILGLLSMVRGGEMKSYEQSVISEALRVLDEDFTDTPPLLIDLTALVVGRHPRLRALVRDRGDEARYDDRVQELIDDLVALGSSGPFGDVFAEHTTDHIEMGRPLDYDLSSVGDSDSLLLAALQSVCWNHGSAVVSADKHLADAGLKEHRHYMLVMDELWRMLRAADVMVYFVDALGRLNRSRAIGQVMITHTMNDLRLANDHLTDIASGFVERSAMVFLGGLAESEMGNLEGVFSLSSKEKAMITDWSSDGAANPDTGTAAEPPALGKFMLKIGKRVGTPFVTSLLDIELEVNDTNTAWRSAVDRSRRAAQGEADPFEEIVQDLESPAWNR